MNVRLAAQVMSNSVTDSLQYLQMQTQSNVLLIFSLLKSDEINHVQGAYF